MKKSDETEVTKSLEIKDAEITSESKVAEFTSESGVEAERLVYIGPTIKNVITENTVMINGMSAGLREIVERFPFVRALIVPASELADYAKRLGESKDSLSMIYKKVLEEVSDGI